MPWASGNTVTSDKLNYRTGLLISVLDPTYSADSTGAADSTASIQLALSQSGTTDTCFIPHGRYLVSQLTLAAGQTILLQGDLVAATDLTTSVLTASSNNSIRIQGIGGRMSGNTSDTLSAIALTSCDDVQIEGLIINDFLNKGVALTTCVDSRIAHNYFSGMTGTTGAAVSLSNCTQGVVAGNSVENCRIGITLNSGELHTVANNTVSDCSLGGIFLDGIVSNSGDGAKRCVVIGNTVDRTFTTTNAPIFWGNGASYNIIANNISSDNTGDGFACSGGASYENEHCLIQGNVAYNNTVHGFSLSNLDNSTIIGNSATSNGDRGIHVFSSDSCAVISNVVEDNVGEGILIQAGNGFYSGNRATGNDEGIEIAAGGDTPNSNVIIGNSTTNNTTNDFVAAGTNTVRNNVGIVTEANGTSTVANGSTYVDVTHTLDYTPSLQDISVTPTNNLGNATKFWIENPGSSQFSIVVDADPGAGTATFAWTVSIQ